MTSPQEFLAKDLRHVAETLARRAGENALTGRRTGSLGTTTKSSPVDMVTLFDKENERIITEGLAQLRPHDAIVGEEGSNTSGTSGITWHVDPIDGTTNFVFDIPTWAVSIGAVDADGLIAGAVFVPALNEMFSAHRNGGATLNGTTISVRDNSSLSDALVATGFSYQAERRTTHAQRVSRMIASVRDIRRFGAAAVDLCFVACGRLDAYFEEGLHSWDLIAGQVIAAEAGALVTNFAGGTVTPPQVLAASPGIQHQLIELLAHSEVAP
jgi:myo-inositol-1(or 4)-monophosphatase